MNLSDDRLRRALQEIVIKTATIDRPESLLQWIEQCARAALEATDSPPEDPVPGPAGRTPSEYAFVLVQWYRHRADLLDVNDS